MSAPVPSTRRLAIAIGTAAASATIAVGVTAASLLGWFRPAATAPPSEAPLVPPTPSPVILVPVAPTPVPQPSTDATGDVQLAMDDRRRSHEREEHDEDDDERREHSRSDHEETDDDD